MYMSSPAQADSELKDQVIDNLAGQHMVELRRLEVKADRGIVTIRGSVRTFHQKQICIHYGQLVAGVGRFNDEIEVNV